MTAQEASEYIAALLEGLTQVAQNANLPFLAYFLNVALQEAQSQRKIAIK